MRKTRVHTCGHWMLFLHLNSFQASSTNLDTISFVRCPSLCAALPDSKSMEIRRTVVNVNALSQAREMSCTCVCVGCP